MNYVSHFYCLKVQNPYYTLGALLPDILNNFSFLHNKHFKSYDPNLLNLEERMLWQGIAQHYADDNFFHSMSFFKKGMLLIEKEMHGNFLLKDLKRKYLISHVLYELILDHMILERSPYIISSIYNDLEAVDTIVLKNFLEKIIGENEEISLFLDSYVRFLNRRFLNFYTVENNLVKSLHMVSGKISQWEFNEEIVKEFVTIIKKVKEEIDLDLVFDCIFKHKDIA